MHKILLIEVDFYCFDEFFLLFFNYKKINPLIVNSWINAINIEKNNFFYYKTIRKSLFLFNQTLFIYLFYKFLVIKYECLLVYAITSNYNKSLLIFNFILNHTQLFFIDWSLRKSQP